MQSSTQMTSEEDNTAQCPVCRSKQKLVTLACCDECAVSLRNTEISINQDIIDTEFTPIIKSEILEECSLAIANSNYEDIGCAAPKSNKKEAKYYKSLNEWVGMMNDLDDVTNSSAIPVDTNEATTCIRWATYISFGINFSLMIGKAVALSASTSYTLISSLADSCLDIIAGTIISCTAKHSKFTRDDLNKYPVGKSRVSTVGLLVFSVLMACCATYIIIECVQSLIKKQKPAAESILSIIIMGVTIGVKLTMAIFYYCLGHPITKALAEDHRNDVITNSIGLFMYWGGHKLGWWMDSTGGIILSLFILVSWFMNAKENAKMLMGVSAPPDVIRALTYVAANHHPLIVNVEQVIAFQVGPLYFAELHVIVPGHIPIGVAHWIGESLQLKIERVPDIERAWVHVDVETHNENEHLLFMRATGKLENRRPSSENDEPVAP
ncbi:cation efflux family protein [Trichomonas vaginalis G3]|uniref:Cation efflux family protein n=1 Tax=Trichomonas vaginalis (strain ATCC PRA-98 / G3) TaxID=412133 RepID=A2FJ34_TRIV3|nr:cation transmembrane transporter protein [Trichomonas vaginalis G3]EAX95098.1 cation efflux family protein [Trichomonas vaginalis G3]KAI5501933.1 cation transmembrane transporter protein [Trichomonas vaginalis G3]|eukprot:XP_001308028.1 cation efflux family protein [Trichomonas vaginalis G3]